MKHWRGILTQNTGFSYLAWLDLNPQSLDNNGGFSYPICISAICGALLAYA